MNFCSSHFARLMPAIAVLGASLGCSEAAKVVGNSPSDAASGGLALDAGAGDAQGVDGVDATLGVDGDDGAPGSITPTPTADAAPIEAASGPGEGSVDEASIPLDAGPDAAGEGGAACAGLFCEDFEQGEIDPAKWDTETGAGGTLDVETQTVAHGQYAMHVHGLAGPADYALIVTKAAPPALSAGAFGRAYFFITPKPLTSGHTSMTFAGTNGTGPAEGPGPFPKLRYMEVANINGGWQIGFDLLDLSPLIEEVAYPAGSPQVPVAVWTCLEWQFSDQPDVVNLWVDGAAIGTFDNEHVSYPGGHTPGSPLYNGTSSGLIGSYTVFGFGFHDWHPNKPFDLYYDDIVLDTKRVGCLPNL
jgi:hypothetical protein